MTLKEKVEHYVGRLCDAATNVNPVKLCVYSMLGLGGAVGLTSAAEAADQEFKNRNYNVKFLAGSMESRSDLDKGQLETKVLTSVGQKLHVYFTNVTTIDYKPEDPTVPNNKPTAFSLLSFRYKLGGGLQGIGQIPFPPKGPVEPRVGLRCQGELEGVKYFALASRYLGDDSGENPGTFGKFGASYSYPLSPDVDLMLQMEALKMWRDNGQHGPGNIRGWVGVKNGDVTVGVSASGVFPEEGGVFPEEGKQEERFEVFGRISP